MEKPSRNCKDEIRAKVLGENADFYAICHCLRSSGVEQYIRDNGWGNLEWQADRLLIAFQKEGILKRTKQGHYELTPTLN